MNKADRLPSSRCFLVCKEKTHPAWVAGGGAVVEGALDVSSTYASGEGRVGTGGLHLT